MGCKEEGEGRMPWQWWREVEWSEVEGEVKKMGSLGWWVGVREGLRKRGVGEAMAGSHGRLVSLGVGRKMAAKFFES